MIFGKLILLILVISFSSNFLMLTNAQTSDNLLFTGDYEGDLSIVYFHESAYIHNAEQFFNILLPTMTMSDSQMIVSSTPNGYDNFFEPLVSKTKKYETEFRLFEFVISDNPKFTDESIAELSRQLGSEKMVRQEVLAEFVKSDSVG